MSQELGFDKDKIGRNHRKYDDFKKYAPKRRRCWKTCFCCGATWKETDTEYVHMVVDFKNETKFICDRCLEKL